MSIEQRSPKLARWFTRLLVALLVAGGLAVYQWSHHAALRHQDSAELRIDQVLGATVEPLDEGVAEDLGLAPNSRGIVVTSLAQGGPAESGGIRPGDVIEQIGSLAVTDPESASDALTAPTPDHILILVNRHGEDVRLDIIPR